MLVIVICSRILLGSCGGNVVKNFMHIRHDGDTGSLKTIFSQ